MTDDAYNFAALHQQTKRMTQPAILKGLLVLGYQALCACREMSMPYGWGTGTAQGSAAVLTPDDAPNAVSIRGFFERAGGVASTTLRIVATIIQSRHRVPKRNLHEGYLVTIPEPLRFLAPRNSETRTVYRLNA